MVRISGCPLPLLLALKWCFLFIPSESFSPEVLALQAFKIAVYEDPLSKLLDWNVETDHCGWTGVECSNADNKVISLNLSSSSLKGFLIQQLSLLSNLQELDLDNNSFLGSIPHQIGMLKNLTLLDLSTNQLTGSIPSEIGNLTSLTKLYLQSNGLMGSIPPEFANLVNLVELRLDVNKLSGAIPDTNDMYASQNNSTGLCQLTQLQVVNFSYNYLVGAIPTCLKVLPSSSFQGNCLEDREFVQQSAEQYGDLLKKAQRLRRREIEEACEDFSNIIGSSLDYVIYKGILKNGHEIAVLSLCTSENLWNGSLELEFQYEVVNLSRLNHANVARLLGFCQEDDPFSRMLVFEYAQNGTLYEHIHSDGNQLTWIRRVKIAIGIARALRYLHTELHPPFAISELTTSTIYLTEDFSPKLVNFERWKAFLSSSRYGSDLPVDSLEEQNVDVQENTYAFGLILLELICGQSAYSDEKGSLSLLALKFLEQPQNIGELVDPALEKIKPEDLSVLSSVASLCVEQEPSKRPSMKIVAAMLEEGIDTSITAILRDSPLAWAELLISS